MQRCQKVHQPWCRLAAIFSNQIFTITLQRVCEQYGQKVSSPERNVKKMLPSSTQTAKKWPDFPGDIECEFDFIATLSHSETSFCFVYTSRVFNFPSCVLTQDVNHQARAPEILTFITILWRFEMVWAFKEIQRVCVACLVVGLSRVLCKTCASCHVICALCLVWVTCHMVSWLLDLWVLLGWLLAFVDVFLSGWLVTWSLDCLICDGCLVGLVSL